MRRGPGRAGRPRERPAPAAVKSVTRVSAIPVNVAPGPRNTETRSVVSSTGSGAWSGLGSTRIPSRMPWDGTAGCRSTLRSSGWSDGLLGPLGQGVEHVRESHAGPGVVGCRVSQPSSAAATAAGQQGVLGGVHDRLVDPLRDVARGGSRSSCRPARSPPASGSSPGRPAPARNGSSARSGSGRRPPTAGARRAPCAAAGRRWRGRPRAARPAAVSGTGCPGQTATIGSSITYGWVIGLARHLSRLAGRRRSSGGSRRSGRPARGSPDRARPRGPVRAAAAPAGCTVPGSSPTIEAEQPVLPRGRGRRGARRPASSGCRSAAAGRRRRAAARRAGRRSGGRRAVPGARRRRGRTDRRSTAWSRSSRSSAASAPSSLRGSASSSPQRTSPSAMAPRCASAIIAARRPRPRRSAARRAAPRRHGRRRRATGRTGRRPHHRRRRTRAPVEVVGEQIPAHRPGRLAGLLQRRREGARTGIDEAQQQPGRAR